MIGKLTGFVDHIGEDYLMVATEYPHSDAVDKFPDKTIGSLTGNSHLSAAARQKILWDNPMKAFALGV